MKRVFLTLSSAAMIALAGCADNLDPEVKDRPPAPYSPDPAANLPQFNQQEGRL